MKKTSKIILTMLIFVMVPIILFILVTSRASLLFGIRSFVVLTGSMEPKVHVASMVITAPASSYNTGDIITFNRGNITVTHRIVGIKNGKFQTKGDANNITDPLLVSKSAVIGKDYLIIPFAGRFTEFVKTVPGFIIFIALPILIYIGFELQTIKKEIEKQTEKRIRKQYEAKEV
jgi:signal peptidase I